MSTQSSASSCVHYMGVTQDRRIWPMRLSVVASWKETREEKIVISLPGSE